MSNWAKDPDAERAFSAAMKQSQVANYVTYLLGSMWLFLSLVVYNDTPLAFQRLGSLGVACAIVSIVLQNRAFEAFENYFSDREHYQMRERVNILHDCSFPEREPLGTVHEGASVEFLFWKPERPLYQQLRSSVVHGRFVIWLEVTWLVVATLQWGYGDLVVQLGGE